jgi:porphobilinogen synthase
MVRETSLSVNDLIQPMFVVHGKKIRKEISALPGNYHLSVDSLVEEVEKIRDLGIPAVLLFGLPEKKDKMGSAAYAPDGIVQKAVRAIKKKISDVAVITDVCLCEYTNHGHCGIIKNGYVDNDTTLDLFAKIALSHAEAGSDILAPAGMMDGQIGAMRTILESSHSEIKSLIRWTLEILTRL